jgi:hypothetical protein
MATVVEEEMIAEINKPPQISWGAVFAGLVLVIASSWLMFLLGSAIGVSVADATDMEVIGEGLSYWAIGWLLLTSLIAFFLGGLLSGRLTGKSEHSVGMMHGVTLWSVATLLMIVLSYAGVSGLLQTGQALVKGVATTGTSMGVAVATGASAADEAGAGLSDLSNSPLMTDIQANLKRKASEILAQSESATGADVSQREAQQAIEQLDAETLKTVGIYLIQGNPERAKSALTVNTGLSEAQINSIVDGVTAEAQQQVEQFQAEFNQRLETVSSYSQALLWTAFISAALGLIVCIIGGWLGSDTVSRLYILARQQTARGSV